MFAVQGGSGSFPQKVLGWARFATAGLRVPRGGGVESKAGAAEGRLCPQAGARRPGGTLTVTSEAPNPLSLDTWGFLEAWTVGAAPHAHPHRLTPTLCPPERPNTPPPQLSGFGLFPRSKAHSHSHSS